MAIDGVTALNGIQGGGTSGNVPVELETPVSLQNGGTGASVYSNSQLVNQIGAFPRAGGTMAGNLTVVGALAVGNATLGAPGSLNAESILLNGTPLSGSAGLPLSGGTITAPAGTSDPLTIAADTGQNARINFNLTGASAHSFTAGITAGRHFVIRDTTRNINPFTIWSGDIGNATDDATAGSVFVTQNGFVVGAPTGGTNGSMGQGTINIQNGIFENGTQLLPLSRTGGTIANPAQLGGSDYGPLTIQAIGGTTAPTPNNQSAQIIYTVMDNNNPTTVLHSWSAGCTPGTHFAIHDLNFNNNPLTIWGGASSDTQHGEVHILINDLICHFGLRVAGDAIIGGTTYPSDRRLKRNIEPWHCGLDEVKRLNPISFEYNGLGGTLDDGRMRVGLDADDAGQVVPEMVRPLRSAEIDGTPVKGISTDMVPIMLINAVKELADRLERIEARIGDR